jgi:hypothetical protein
LNDDFYLLFVINNEDKDKKAVKESATSSYYAKMQRLRNNITFPIRFWDWLCSVNDASKWEETVKE